MCKNPFLIVIFLLFIFDNVIGQTANPLPSNTMSPGSYSQEKSNANYYTGLPSVTIPLHTYSRNSLSLTLALHYSSFGTQTTKLASSVGLGWSLQHSGGYVRRVVVGLPDEYKYTDPKSGSIRDVGYLNTPNVNTSPDKTYLNQLYHNVYDTEADIYEFNFEGYAGRILINKAGQVVGTAPKSDLLISYTRLPNQGRINSFLFRTPDGIVYNFSDEEVLKFSAQAATDPNHFEYSSSWLLHSIYSVTNPLLETILFSYEDFYSNDIVGKNYFYAYPSDINTINMIQAECRVNAGCCVGISAWQYMNQDAKVDGILKRLTKIRLGDGSEVRLNYRPHTRMDLAYDKALHSVEINNVYGKTVKKYVFDYTYMTSNGEVGYGYYGSLALDLSSRLMLKKVYEEGVDQTTLPPYEFEYETSITLPARNAVSGDDQAAFPDNWGFMRASTTYPDGGAKAYMLKKVKYPSGAFTAYEYEKNTINWTKNSNGFQTIGGIRLKRIKTNEGVATQNETEVTLDYTLGPNQSSGEVDYLPISDFTTHFDLGKMGSCNGNVSYMKYAPYSNQITQSPIEAFPTGNACGYSKVTEEIRSGTQSLGKKVYYFKNFSDYQSEASLQGLQGQIDFPYPNKTYNIPWGLGLPYKTEIYDNSNRILKRIENNYSVEATRLSSADMLSFKAGVLYGPWDRSNSAANGDVFKYEHYAPLTGKTTLTGTVNTDFTYIPGNATPQTRISQVDYEYVSNKDLIRSTSSQDSKGNTVKQIFRYAFDYTLPAHEAIAFFNSNKMTTPVIATETWITKNGVDYLMASEVHDFKVFRKLNLWGGEVVACLKPFKSYALRLDIPLAANAVPGFDGTSLFRLSSNLYEEMISYDAYTDANELVLSTEKQTVKKTSVYGRYGLIPLAIATNSRQDQCGYSSFEDLPGYAVTNEVVGNLKLSGYLQYYESITGSRAFKGQITPAVQVPAGQYRVTLWEKGNAATVSAPVIIEGKKLVKSIGNWNLFSWLISLPSAGQSFTVDANGSIMDEVKFYPKDAALTTVTYNKLLQKVADCSASNNITYYFYDQFGRMVLIRDENKNVLQRFCNNLTNQPDNCDLWGNYEQSVVYTKNDCPSGSLGTQTTFTVLADTYFTTNSYTAWTLAQNDLNENAATFQTIANAKGTCTNTTIYVRLERTGNYSYSDPYYDIETTNYVVKFYSDPGGNNPLPLPQDLNVYYHYSSISQNPWGYYTYTNDSFITASMGTTEDWTFGYTELKYCTHDGYSWSCYFQNYNLTPAANYVIIN